VSVTHVENGSFVANATTATLTLTTPGGALEGDILIAVILLKSNPDFGGPADWNALVNLHRNTTAQQLEVWWRRATSADVGPQSYLFSKDADDNILMCGLISTWRGAKATGDPFDTTPPSFSDNPSQDAVNYATFDPASSDCHVIAVGVYNQDLTTAGSISGTNPAYVNRWDHETATGTDASGFGYSGDSNGAATGARSHSTTSTADAISIGCQFALLPEPAPAADELFSEVVWRRRRASTAYRFKPLLRGDFAYDLPAEAPPIPDAPGDWVRELVHAARRRWILPWRFRRGGWPADFEPIAEVELAEAGAELVHAARRRGLYRWRFPKRAPAIGGELEFVAEVEIAGGAGELVYAARRRTFSGWRFRAGVRPGGFEFEGLEPEPEAPVVERRPLSEYVKFELGHRQGIKFDRR
jgi:hypothetical protein